VLKSFSYVLAIKSFLKIIYDDYTLKTAFLKVIRGKNSNFDLNKEKRFRSAKGFRFPQNIHPRVSIGCT